MEPTDLKSNHSARLAGGRMSLDETAWQDIADVG
jgi:hypothetical protein